MVYRRKCTGFLLTNLSSPHSFLPPPTPTPHLNLSFLTSYLSESQFLLSFLLPFYFFLSSLVLLLFILLPLHRHFLSLLFLLMFSLGLPGLKLGHPSMYFYYFYSFLQPYLLKYLLTLFPFHKATTIYTPIHAEAGEVDGGERLVVGLKV